MKSIPYILFIAVFFLFSEVAAQTNGTGNIAGQKNVVRGVDAPVSLETRTLLEKGVRLAEDQDKVAAGLALIKQAIAAAPHFVKAHSEYVRLKSYWLNEEAQTRAEYEALMKKEPKNPVYPLALANGAIYASVKEKQDWLSLAVQLEPDTAWGHYAVSKSIQVSNPELALEESLKAVEKDSDEILFYDSAFSLLLKQKKFAEAAALLEKIKTRPEWRAFALRSGWSLRSAQADNSAEVKKAIDDELEKLTRESNDLKILLAVRSQYKILKNEQKLKFVEEKISRLDPTWYAERGAVMFTVNFENSTPERTYFAGRQFQIYNKLKAIGGDLNPKEQLARALTLLTPAAGETVKKSIYRRIFDLALQAKDYSNAVKYGELILAANPNDTGILTALTQIYSGDEKKDLKKALRYSQTALELTDEARFAAAAAERKKSDMILPEEAHKQMFEGRRIAALNARASVLEATGDNKNAENLIRQSLALKPTAGAYFQLENVLKNLGRAAEAAEAAAERENFWRKVILAAFTSEPAKDFELANVKGERVKLSALKGKLVIINFWATWCVPCIEEMPMLVELYDKYKSQGLEILAVSVDSVEDRPKIPGFAAKTGINFPILYDENAASLYGVRAYPTTLFIDRAGNLRYRSKGLDTNTARRDLEFVIQELLKNES